MSKSKIIAIIPARKNSKRIKNKNIASFNGKPMIFWTIKAAIDSKLFDRIVVSTDSILISKIAKDAGAEVPFIRSKKLADNKTHVEKATIDCLNRVEKLYEEKYDIVVQLMPNSPLRNAKDIKSAYSNFIRQKAPSQISCILPNGINPWWSFKIENHKVKRLFPKSYSERSQDLDKLYCPTGAIWISKSEELKKQNTFISKYLIAHELYWVNGIDIDTPEDLEIAKILIKLSK